MAIIVITNDPSGLLKSMKDEMNAKKIVTWTVDSDGDFTHAPAQWRTKAWLRPLVQADRLIFIVLHPQGKTVSVEAYGVYHGRFIEMLLNHFDSKFTQASATALPDFGDLIGNGPPS